MVDAKGVDVFTAQTAMRLHELGPHQTMVAE